MNGLKTFFFLGLLTLMLVWAGNLLGGRQGMIIAFIIAMAMNFFSYWFSDRIVLKAYKARPVSQTEAPELYGLVNTLALEAGLPMPQVCIIPNPSPNAFATGRNPEHAVVAVTEGLLNLLNKRELKGVLAHELSHVKHRDILIGSVAATLAGAVMILANMARYSALLGGNNRDNRGGSNAILLLLSFLAPLGAMIIQMAVSRRREYMADASGAAISHDPGALASALNKLDQYGKSVPMPASPQTAHMFTVNPLHGGGLMSLFSTHPPIAERIARLQAMTAPSVQVTGGEIRDYSNLSSHSGQYNSQPSLRDAPGRKKSVKDNKYSEGGKIDWS
ncbi:MAG: zinc metalloprotease HtpX [Desulfarculales bacterium]|jgi:heat shock protein HtpX|nr:zinc metalloprotease HtpX [Desulfarculales bacterium]